MGKAWSHLEVEARSLSDYRAGARPSLQSARCLWLVQTGIVGISHDGAAIDAQPGTLLWRRAGQLMNIGSAPESPQPAQVLALRIRHPAFAAQVVADRDALMVLAALDSLSQEHGPVLPLSSSGTDAVQRLLAEMAEAWLQPDSAVHSLVLKGDGLRVLATLRADATLGPLLATQTTAGPGQLAAADRIEPALRLCEDRRALLGQAWRVADLADRCGLSQAQFHRCFKRVTGQTPRRYVAGLRVVHATELLLQPDLSLSEIAQRCGFSTTARLHAAFVQEHGYGPGQWRREMFAAGEHGS